MSKTTRAGMLLRKWIEVNDTTQMKLAADLGVSQTAVSAWLGGSEPRATIAGKLQEIAGIPIAAWGESVDADETGSRAVVSAADLASVPASSPDLTGS